MPRIRIPIAVFIPEASEGLLIRREEAEGVSKRAGEEQELVNEGFATIAPLLSRNVNVSQTLLPQVESYAPT